MEYKALYKVKEVAEILLVNPASVYKLIRSGELPAIKLGEIKVRGRDLEMFLNNYPAISNEDREEEIRI
jgi:excisionase family DNA binding protein